MNSTVVKPISIEEDRSLIVLTEDERRRLAELLVEALHREIETESERYGG